MKIILLQDVKGQGKKGDLVEASDGYARNFLLPRKLAKIADAGSVKQIEIRKESEAFHLSEEKKKAEELKKSLASKEIVFNTTGGVDGRLYGAVTAKDVSDRLKSDFSIDIDKRLITLSENIKTVGEYSAKIKLFQGIYAQIKIIVKA